ncbi:ganglioside induced differentiation associated protein 1 [Lycorma delicatula]|uniref:ganglioside induced differentiation associated protein 1 n=1 Tax=Lycorma delicatula TaxID=130591 RepID=UPI003F51AC45
MNNMHNWKKFIYRFCSNYHLNLKVMAASSAVSSSSSKSNEKGNGLILYFNHYSFYAQKVVMAMMEKKLPFKPHNVDITRGEQYQSWFLEINPRGEVPVLVDGVKTIPDSARIIDYLEDNFSNGDTPRLMPTDQGPQVRQKIEHFRDIIDQLPANVITMGSFLHPEFAPNPKLPFIAPVRKHLLSADEKTGEMLRSVAEKQPQLKDILLKKVEAHAQNRTRIITKEGFENLLHETDSVLTEVEKELELHKDDKTKWLCTDKFTIADISLTILLDRLYLLGMESYFWTNGKKPCLEEYYARVRQRDSYKKTVPSNMLHLKTFLEMQSHLFIGLSAVTLIASLFGGMFYMKKK